MGEPVAFTATVQDLGRVAIPKTIRDALKIKQGTLVTLTVKVVEPV